MKKVLAFDVDNTLNLAKTPITSEMAALLTECLNRFEVAPISGQKFEQFLIQIVDQLTTARPSQLKHLHLFVAQGTQYYAYDGKTWQLKYNLALTKQQAQQIAAALEQAARELGYWEADKLAPGDQIIENRGSMIAYSALGQRAAVDAKLAWDPNMTKRQAMSNRAKQLAPDYDFEVGGTTTINAFLPGMNKQFGMNKMMEYLNVKQTDILYFGDMTQPGGNDYPVVQMGIETITVRDWQETANILRGILSVTKPA
jgi:HAD superfamily hydrolase (TIGR01484 family)